MKFSQLSKKERKDWQLFIILQWILLAKQEKENWQMFILLQELLLAM